MTRLLTIAVLLLGACSSADERAVQRALHAGASAYKAGRFADAAEAFTNAPEDVRLAYNAGNSEYRLDRYDQAVSAFQSAEGMADSLLAERILYNLGTARLKQARQADSLAKAYAGQAAGIRIEGDDIAEKVKLYVLRDSLRRDFRKLDDLVDSALTDGAKVYRKALLLDPNDDDARHNLVATQRFLAARAKAAGKDNGKDGDEQKALGERAKLLMQQADELVEQYKFAEALAVLRAGIKQDPTLEQRKEYMDKLDLVTKASTTP